MFAPYRRIMDVRHLQQRFENGDSNAVDEIIGALDDGRLRVCEPVNGDWLIRGRDGRSLKEDWGRDIRTTMGLQVHGYPNLFTTAVPLAPSAALCNMTTCLQQQVDWISDCIGYARNAGKRVIEPTEDFEDRWVRHHDETAAATLVVKTDSWYMGSNVDGKPRRLLSYIGGAGAYHRQCDELAAGGYPGFRMT